MTVQARRGIPEEKLTLRAFSDVECPCSSSYALNGIGQFKGELLEDIVREPDVTWVIPTEDEWYKAAYHKNDGATGSYWNHPTQTDGVMSHLLVDPDPGDNATASGGTFGDWTMVRPAIAPRWVPTRTA